MNGTEFTASQDLTANFLDEILTGLRRSRLVASQGGAMSGYHLEGPASSIKVADVMRAVDGPLAEVRGMRPEAAHDDGSANDLQEVWIAVRASLRKVPQHTTIADVAFDKLPAHIKGLAADPDVWAPH
jgi:Rrf2 family protein